MPEQEQSLAQDQLAVKLNMTRLSADAVALGRRERRVKISNNLKTPVEKAIAKTTERVERVGNLPERFPSEDDSILVERRTGYLTSALATTRNRLARYYEPYS